MKLFTCQHCGQLLYFENTGCERCGRPGLPARARHLERTRAGGRAVAGAGKAARRYRACANAICCSQLAAEADAAGACCPCCTHRARPLGGRERRAVAQAPARQEPADVYDPQARLPCTIEDEARGSASTFWPIRRAYRRCGPGDDGARQRLITVAWPRPTTPSANAAHRDGRALPHAAGPSPP